MNKIFMGSVLGLVLGAGAMFGVAKGVPAVRDIISSSTASAEFETLKKDYNDLKKSNDQLTLFNEELLEKSQVVDSLSKENSELKTEVLESRNRINILSQEITETKSTLADKNSVLSANELEISNKNNRITTLETEIDSLKVRISEYEQLVGSDINYVSLIADLNIKLSEKQQSLDTLTTERDELLTRKNELESEKLDLISRLEASEKELSGYRSLGNIEPLNISNFEGVWYLDGKFTDYYTIQSGIVTHNGNEDKGLLNPIYNEMYMMMNIAGGKSVILSDDGLSFTTDDTLTYKKFYINTYEEVTVDNFGVLGKFNKLNETYELKNDYTLTYEIDGVTYHGAYSLKQYHKNLGGNESDHYFITATINKSDDEQIVKTFTCNSINKVLVDSELNAFDCISSYSLITANSCSMGSNYGTTRLSLSQVDSYTNSIAHVYVSLNSLIEIKSRLAISCSGLYGTNSFGGGINYNYLEFSSDVVGSKTNVIDFYISSSSSNLKLESVNSIDGVVVRDCSFEIIEKQKSYINFSNFYLRKPISSLTDSPSSYIQTLNITDYTNAKYSNEDMTISLQDNTGTIRINEMDIISDSVTIDSKTDYENIYQTVTITYKTNDGSQDTNHIIILELTNNKLISSKLDDETISLNKTALDIE